MSKSKWLLGSLLLISTILLTSCSWFNQPPVAQISVSTTSGEAPLTVNFDGTASYDPNGSISYYDWNFGDGDYADEATASHTYEDDGSFTVTLTVTDNSGATDSDSVMVTVTNPPPVADFTYSPSNPKVGDTVTFDATPSYDPASSVNPESTTHRSWDFGDGNTGSGMTVTHAYSSQGTYDVTLTVTDDDLASNTITKTVTVKASGPTISEIEDAADRYKGTDTILWVFDDNGELYAWGNAVLIGRYTTDSGKTYDVWLSVRHMFEGTDYTYYVDSESALAGGYNNKFFVFITKPTQFTPFDNISSSSDPVPWSQLKQGMMLYRVAWEYKQGDFYPHIDHGLILSLNSPNIPDSIAYKAYGEKGYSGSLVLLYKDLNKDGQATSNEFLYVGLHNKGKYADSSRIDKKPKAVREKESWVTYGIPDPDSIQTTPLGNWKIVSMSSKLQDKENILNMIKEVINQFH